MALLYPNLRDADPLRISEKVISGEASRLEPECVSSVLYSLTNQILARGGRLTVLNTLAATAVITSCLNWLDREGLGVHGHSAHGHRAPSLSVWTLLARAARPAPAFALELAVLERAVGRRGLGCRERYVAARRLISRLEIDERRRAVVPVDGCVGAGMVSRMSVAHCDCLFVPENRSTWSEDFLLV